jgi:serine/threonine-protein kinase RsbW
MSHNGWSWSEEAVIPSNLGAGKDILHAVLGKLEASDWLPRDIHGVHLAMEEALVNAIKHGNRLDESKSVRVVCRFRPDAVRIEIADEGPGFKPEEVPDCTADDRLEVPSGRGIMLMRAFMSLVEYNDLGNQVVMEKRLGEQAAGD